jgi:hypothetical protein
MKEFKIEVVEKNTFTFKIAAETEHEAADIVRNSWLPVSEQNLDCLHDSESEIFVYSLSNRETLNYRLNEIKEKVIVNNELKTK